MAKAKSVHHVLDIYGTHLHLVHTPRQWKALRKRLEFMGDVPDSDGLSHMAVWVPNDAGKAEVHIVLWLDVRKIASVADLADTCAHEASHATHQLFHHIGHEVQGTDEPSAYLVGWLTGWMMANTPYPVE